MSRKVLARFAVCALTFAIGISFYCVCFGGCEKLCASLNCVFQNGQCFQASRQTARDDYYAERNNGGVAGVLRTNATLPYVQWYTVPTCSPECASPSRASGCGGTQCAGGTEPVKYCGTNG